MEIEVEKNMGQISHATICLRGLTMLFLLPVIAILVNELLRKMIQYQVIIFRSD